MQTMTFFDGSECLRKIFRKLKTIHHNIDDFFLLFYGCAKFFSHPFVATGVMVIIGCGMGFMNLSQIWGVFGAANQLLAGIAMLAVATWLGNIGKNNKMFFVPMVFMLVATITSLCMTVIAKVKLIAAAGAAWGDWFQMIWSIGLVVLAVILVIQGIQILTSKKEQKAA